MVILADPTDQNAHSLIDVLHVAQHLISCLDFTLKIKVFEIPNGLFQCGVRTVSHSLLTEQNIQSAVQYEAHYTVFHEASQVGKLLHVVSLNNLQTEQAYRYFFHHLAVLEQFIVSIFHFL